MFSLLDVYESYSTTVSFIADNIAVLTVVVTLAVFIRALAGVFPSGLRKVFAPMGITWLAIARAILICWRSRSDQRLFFEFALIRSQGEKLDYSAWDELCGDFAVFSSLSHSQGDAVIEIKNCTQLTSREFVAATARYFDFLGTHKASLFYSIGRYDDYWHSRVRIIEAYITPSVLLSGLMSRYDSNWALFIDQYRAFLPRAGVESLRSAELYSLFSWLLWGPSCEIKWRDGWDGLCQIAYGDESNSLLAYADCACDVQLVLKDAFLNSSNHGCFGALFSPELRLAPKKEFLEQFRFGMNVANAYYVDKLMQDEGLSFVPCIESVKPVDDRIATRWYSTAYLWLLFEQECDDGRFHPEKSVAFFEHANIADANVCAFLSERLAEKTIAHFRDISCSKELCSSRYRFICGMNSVVEQFCINYMKDITGDGQFSQWMKEHVSFVRQRVPTTVFYAFDELFAGSEQQLEFLDIKPHDSRGSAELALFYSGIYSDSFTNQDERESLTNIFEYLKRAEKSKVWDFHVVLAKDKNGQLVGGVIFDYFSDVNSVVIEFICVDESLRSRHIGRKIWIQILKMADSVAQKNGLACAEYVFCEVESPQMKNSDDVVHLSFWRNNWFRRLDFEYVQPALGADRNAVRGMWFLGLIRNSDARQEIDVHVLRKVLWNYVHYSMSIERPEANSDFRYMLMGIENMKSVSLMDFECSKDSL